MSDIAKIKKAMQKSKNGMFSERKNCNEAFEYASSMAKCGNITPAEMTVAIMVYHNTLLQQFIDQLEG